MKGVKYYTLLAILLFIIMILLYLSIFYMPFKKEYLRITREISVLQSELDNINEDIFENYNNKEGYIKEISLEIEKAVEKLPNNLRSHDILDMLSGLNELNIKMKSLIFLNHTSNELFTVLPVRISFSTNFEGISEVFGYLDSLSVPMGVSSFQFAAEGEAISKNDGISGDVDVKSLVGYNLDVVMTVNFYIRSEAKEVNPDLIMG